MRMNSPVFALNWAAVTLTRAQYRYHRQRWV
jgi:hypothetical protein